MWRGLASCWQCWRRPYVHIHEEWCRQSSVYLCGFLRSTVSCNERAGNLYAHIGGYRDLLHDLCRKRFCRFLRSIGSEIPVQSSARNVDRSWGVDVSMPSAGPSTTLLMEIPALQTLRGLGVWPASRASPPTRLSGCWPWRSPSSAPDGWCKDGPSTPGHKLGAEDICRPLVTARSAALKNRCWR